MMRQMHVAGEKLFMDFAGDTVPVFHGASEKSAGRTCLSPCSGRRTKLMPKPAGRGGPLALQLGPVLGRGGSNDILLGT